MLLIHDKDFFLNDLTRVGYTLKQGLVDVVSIIPKNKRNFFDVIDPRDAP